MSGLWSILNGTLINAVAVAGGTSVGLLVTGKVPERFQRIILDVLGLITITLGIDATVNGMSSTVARYMPPGDAGKTYGARLALVMVASLVIGALIGTALRLHQRIEDLGGTIHKRFGSGDAHRFAEAFLSASVIFCVGPLTLLGCLQNGVHGDPSYLYIKSLLDGFCSIALTATLGVGVAFSVLTVLIFQGGLALLFHFGAGSLPDLSIQMINIVGGVMLLATALMILAIKRIPVADMLPGLAVAPLIVWIVESVSPGLLITQAGGAG